MPKLIPQHYPLFGYYTTRNEVGAPSAVIGWRKVDAPGGGWTLTPALVPVDHTTFMTNDGVYIGDYGPGTTYSLFTTQKECVAEQKAHEAKFHGWDRPALEDPDNPFAKLVKTAHQYEIGDKVNVSFRNGITMGEIVGLVEGEDPPLCPIHDVIDGEECGPIYRVRLATNEDGSETDTFRVVEHDLS